MHGVSKELQRSCFNRNWTRKLGREIPTKYLDMMERLIYVKGKNDLLICIEEIFNELFDGSKPMHNGMAKIFWHTLRQILPKDVCTTKFPVILQNCKVNAKRREMASLGLCRNGTKRQHVHVWKTKTTIAEKSETNYQNFVDTLHFDMMGSFKDQIKNLKTLNRNLVKNTLSSKNATNNKSHKRDSLGKTVVSGGKYGNKEKELVVSRRS
jgi:hypothetical protein